MLCECSSVLLSSVSEDCTFDASAFYILFQKISCLGLGFMFRVCVKVLVWGLYLGVGFRFGVQAWGLGFEFRYRFRVLGNVTKTIR